MRFVMPTQVLSKSEKSISKKKGLQREFVPGILSQRRRQVDALTAATTQHVIYQLLVNSLKLYQKLLVLFFLFFFMVNIFIIFISLPCLRAAWFTTMPPKNVILTKRPCNSINDASVQQSKNIDPKRNCRQKN